MPRIHKISAGISTIRILFCQAPSSLTEAPITPLPCGGLPPARKLPKDDGYIRRSIDFYGFILSECTSAHLLNRSFLKYLDYASQCEGEPIGDVNISPSRLPKIGHRVCNKRCVVLTVSLLGARVRNTLSPSCSERPFPRDRTSERSRPVHGFEQKGQRNSVVSVCRD